MQELQEIFNDSFRKIKVYRSLLNSVQFILFPNDQNECYKIITRKNVSDLRVENLARIIREELNKQVSV